MPTENRSNDAEMVSVPRDLIDLTLAHLPNDSAAKWEIHDLLAQSSEQHQGEPVALPAYKMASAHSSHDWDQGHRDGWTACLDEVAKLGPLYTHADAGEVERLRDTIEQLGRERRVALRGVERLEKQLAERDALLREFLEVATGGFSDSDHVLRVRRHLEAFLSASAEPSAIGDETRDARDYAIEHAGYLADAADQVLADYQAYTLAQMLENEGGDDGDTEHEESVDSARDDLHEGLANLRSMAYEFRKRRHQAAYAASGEPQVTA